MVEKEIRGRICHAIHNYSEANNKYMKDFDKNKESSCLKYWDVNNLYGWAMSQKLLVNNFEWTEETSQFYEYFIKNFNEESEEGYFLEVDVQYPKNYMKFKMIYHFYQNKIKTEKAEKLVANLCDNTRYVIHIRNLKQALNHGLILKKVHRVIKFNQNDGLKPYIDMNTELRKKAKHKCWENFYQVNE